MTRHEIIRLVAHAEAVILGVVSSGIAVTPRFLLLYHPTVGRTGWIVALALDGLTLRGRLKSEYHYGQRMFLAPGVAEDINAGFRKHEYI